ncbi:MAG: hypothetical protein E6J90_01435 [Deltaproteobacteria bacterium]|nr:MAG: hypothetical protein E6J90_01435 [Deltaproteobacteria bacterium]
MSSSPAIRSAISSKRCPSSPISSARSSRLRACRSPDPSRGDQRAEHQDHEPADQDEQRAGQAGRRAVHAARDEHALHAVRAERDHQAMLREEPPAAARRSAGVECRSIARIEPRLGARVASVALRPGVAAVRPVAVVRPGRDRERRIDVARDQLVGLVVERQLDALGAKIVEGVVQRGRRVDQALEVGDRRRCQLVLGVGRVVRPFGEEHDGRGQREQHELADAERDQPRRQRPEPAARAQRGRAAGVERGIPARGHASPSEAPSPSVSM